MKRIFTIFGALLICGSAHAGVITVNTISADSTETTLNDNFSEIADEINGNLEGSTAGSAINIKADSLGEGDMGDDINPRIRDNELLGIGEDTTSVSSAIRISGLQPATATGLTSNISAGTAYVNGFRVTKTATAHTYTASRDTYVDLDQSGNYSFSEVANGAAEPAVANNSIRLALAVTDGTDITTVTDLSSTRIPNLIIPTDYRSGMIVSRDSSSTTSMTITPGSVEINNAIVATTTLTTIDADTAGDWASGTEDVASSGYVYIYVDTAGNIKFDDTAPTHQNYDVSVTAGRFRYATTTGSTVGRILGWGYRDGSGNINTYEYGNFREADAFNTVQRVNSADATVNDTSYGTDITNMTLNYYSSGNPLLVDFSGWAANVSDVTRFDAIVTIDGVEKSGSQTSMRTNNSSGGSTDDNFKTSHLEIGMGQGTHTIDVKSRVLANSLTVKNRRITATEL